VVLVPSAISSSPRYSSGKQGCYGGEQNLQIKLVLSDFKEGGNESDASVVNESVDFSDASQRFSGPFPVAKIDLDRPNARVLPH